MLPLLLLQHALAGPATPYPPSPPDLRDNARSGRVLTLVDDGEGGAYALVRVPHTPDPTAWLGSVDLLAPLPEGSAPTHLLLRLGPDGAPMWGTGFRSMGAHLAAGPGGVVLAADFTGAIGFDDEVLFDGESGRFHTLVAVFAPDGHRRWAQALDGAAPMAVAMDAGGVVSAAVRFREPWDLDGDHVSCGAPGTADHTAIVRLTGQRPHHGVQVWCVPEDAWSRQVSAMHVGAGQLAVVGAEQVRTAGGWSHRGVVMLLDEDGRHRWTRAMPGPGGAPRVAVDVRVDPDGVVVLGHADVGGTLRCEWRCPTVLWAFEPDGRPRWTRDWRGRIGLTFALEGKEARVLGTQRAGEERGPTWLWRVDRRSGSEVGAERVDLPDPRGLHRVPALLSGQVWMSVASSPGAPAALRRRPRR